MITILFKEHLRSIHKRERRLLKKVATTDSGEQLFKIERSANRKRKQAREVILFA